MNANAPVLLETMRCRHGHLPLRPLHEARLRASCAALGLPFVELPVPGPGPDRVIRAELSVQGATFSERPVGSVDPVHLVVSPVVHEPYRHKTLARAQFEQTLNAARSAGADDGILLTTDGYVAETAIWTLFWWESSHWCAPAGALGVLPAVSRARLEQLVEVREGRARVGELAGRPLLVGNAARGLVPVATLEGQALPGHPDTPRLREAFWP